MFLYHTQEYMQKWIEDLNVRPKVIKVLEENIAAESQILLVQYFIGWILPSKGNKRKNKQMGPHQTKKFSHSKGNH